MRPKKYAKIGIVLALILMLIGISTMVSKYNSHNDRMEQERIDKLNQVSSYYDLFFEDKIEKINGIATNQMILNYFKDVQTVEALETHHDYEKVHQFIVDQKENANDIDFVYISSYHVRSIMSEPYFEVPEDYMPSERGWFIYAMKSDGIVTGNVFIDAFTYEPYITLSRTIKDTEVHGVVGVDINMMKIQNYIDEQGDVLLVDDGYVLAISENLKSNFNIFRIQDLFEEPVFEDGNYDISYRGYDLSISVLTEDFTGHKILILNDNAVDNRLIISSLVQTFVVFLIMSCLMVLVFVRMDKKIVFDGEDE